MPRKSDFSPVELDKRSFTEIVIEQIKKHARDPNKIAFINAHNQSEIVTFSQLYKNIHCLATFLGQRGFGWKDVACIISSNCWEFACAFLAVSLCGGAFSGASYLFTKFELQQQISNCNAKLVFCCADTLETTRDAIKTSPNVKTLIIISDKQTQIELGPNEFLFHEILKTTETSYFTYPMCDPKTHVLLIPYSSGTTGQPKGVMITHLNLIAMIEMYNEYYKIHIWPKIDKNFCPSKETIIMKLPCYHLYGLFLVAQSLWNGTKCILMRKFDGELFCECIEKFKTRVQFTVPTIILFLAKSPLVDKYDLSSLRFILAGAAPLGGELCEEVKRRIPQLKYIVQGYGMTETSVASHFPVIFDKPNSATVGKIAPNMEEMIVDVETGEEVPNGKSGEIWVKGPNITLGYWNNSKATSETIDKEGWLHTGDIGYLDKNNCLYIVDRLKELIKVKGLQVAPAELEAILLTHPKIEDCGVVGISDQVVGERPKAFIVKRDKTLTASQIHQYLKDKVAPYKQLKDVEFLEIIPRSPAGKILRRQLRDSKSKL